ncbi:MAG: hypothetical protein ACFFDP_07685, partial [Promethearchaeota archaeon]
MKLEKWKETVQSVVTITGWILVWICVLFGFLFILAIGFSLSVWFVYIWLGNPLAFLIPQIFGVAGTFVLAAFAVYSAYRTFLKGPDVRMAADPIGGAWKVVHENSPQSPNHLSRLWLFADIFFFNSGNRAGIIKDLKIKFIPSKDFSAFLHESPTIYPFKMIKHPLEGGSVLDPIGVYLPFSIKDGEVDVHRIEARCELNIDLDRQDKPTYNKTDWLAFLEGS